MTSMEKQQAGKIYNISNVTNMYVDNLVVPQQDPPIPQTLSDKRRYITDTKQSRYLLDDYSDNEEFEFYPDRLYILSLYFITLKYRDEQYVLLDYVSYAPLVKEGLINDDIWSVPYTLVPIEFSGKKVRKIREIRAVYNEALPGMREKLSTLEYGLFYNLGIAYKEIEKGREYIEYKQSTTEPDKMRCNYIREFYVHDVDSTGILSLTDPECLHQHRYLPLALLDQMPKNKRMMRFWDKPIPYNVTDVLLYERRRLLKNAISIKQDDLIFHMEGVLFIISVMDNNKAANIPLTEILQQGMLYANVGRFQIYASTLIGCLPYKRVNFTDLLCRLYAGLSQISPSVTIRCTALYSNFDYGKPLGLASQTPSFSGKGYGKLIKMDIGAAFAWSQLEVSPDIFLGYEEADEDAIIFAPENIKEYHPKIYREENRKMTFKVWEKANE